MLTRSLLSETRIESFASVWNLLEFGDKFNYLLAIGNRSFRPQVTRPQVDSPAHFKVNSPAHSKLIHQQAKLTLLH